MLCSRCSGPVRWGSASYASWVDGVVKIADSIKSAFSQKLEHGSPLDKYVMFLKNGTDSASLYHNMLLSKTAKLLIYLRILGPNGVTAIDVRNRLLRDIKLMHLAATEHLLENSKGMGWHGLAPILMRRMLKMRSDVYEKFSDNLSATHSLGHQRSRLRHAITDHIQRSQFEDAKNILHDDPVMRLLQLVEIGGYVFEMNDLESAKWYCKELKVACDATWLCCWQNDKSDRRTHACLQLSDELIECDLIIAQVVERKT